MSAEGRFSLKLRCAVLAAALWWGGLSAVGGMAVPLLFRHLPTPAMAGNMAAQLFSALVLLAMACAAALVLLLVGGASAWGSRRTRVLWAVGVGLLAALGIEWGAAPHILARDNLRLWHTLASALFALQWLCAGAALCWLVPGGSVKNPS